MKSLLFTIRHIISLFVNDGSEAGEPYGASTAPATGSGQMPGFGGREDDDDSVFEPLLTPEQLNAIVAYERSL